MEIFDHESLELYGIKPILAKRAKFNFTKLFCSTLKLFKAVVTLTYITCMDSLVFTTNETHHLIFFVENGY